MKDLSPVRTSNPEEPILGEGIKIDSPFFSFYNFLDGNEYVHIKVEDDNQGLYVEALNFTHNSGYDFRTDIQKRYGIAYSASLGV